MTLLVFERPKIITKPAKCDCEDLARAHSPCAATKPQPPRRICSYLCIQKCPSNGSIIIETLIKVLQLKDKQIGRDSVTRSASRRCRAALRIAGCKSAPLTLWLEAPKGPPLSPNLWPMTPAGDLRGLRTPGCLPVLFAPSFWISTYVKKQRTQGVCMWGSQAQLPLAILPPLPFLFVLSVCPHFPPTSDLHFCYSDSLTCSTTAIQTSSSTWLSPFPLSSPRWVSSLCCSAEERAETEKVNEHHTGVTASSAAPLAHTAGQAPAWAPEQ